MLERERFLSYRITDPSLYSRRPTRFALLLRRARGADITTLRDSSLPRPLIKRFPSLPIEGLLSLSGSWSLARRFGIGSVHFKGDQLELAKRARRSGLFTIYSAHTREDLRRARGARIHLITYSPIFPSPKKGAPLGLRELRRVTRRYKNIIALGGIISRREIGGVRRVGARGFASIRYFMGGE
ncbi:MAG: thiamine phosphate synthase [Epsilonproteobacteria bacterium]|nr:hypothetical protein [Campylobacterota bacterium]NPA57514.1 thiamine phosphate synthase [Campylobacterota bacterium]